MPFGSDSHPQSSTLGDSILGHSPFLQVRPARLQDIRPLADVLASSFHQQTGGMAWLYPVLRLGIYEDLRSRLRSPTQHYVCLVAMDRRPASPVSAAAPERDRIVGTVEMGLRTHYPWQPRCGQTLYISNLAVQAGYRRQGIGLKLLQVCEQIGKDWAFQSISLHVLETNHQARGLYQKGGYQCCGVEAGLKTWFLGQPRRLLMQKTLLPADATVAFSEETPI